MSATTLPGRERRERTVNWPRMRPRFKLELACSADQIMTALREDEEDARESRRIEGTFSERHGVLRLREEERQFWSTHLGLTIEDAGRGPEGTPQPTRLLGVFSPQPEVWTAYVFAIGILTVIAVFGVMCAIVQVSLGHWPWALLASVFAALLGALLYTSTLVGQGLAAGEMYELRSYLDDRIEEAENRHRSEPATARESAQL